MVNTQSNVIAGRPATTGGVLIAAVGTALPTDTTTALNVAFVASGYVADDGVQQTVGRDTTPIHAWGTDLVKTTQTSFDVSFQFTFIEALSANVLKAVFGDGNVTTTAATGSSGALNAVAVNSASLPNKSFIFEIKDGAAKIRVVIPNGQITAVGDTTYSDGALVGYQVTLSCYSDASGNPVYIYTNDGKPTS